MTHLTIQDIGEQGMLKRVQSFCPATIVGDDAAVLATQSGMSLVVTTDGLVDGVHFSETTTPPHAVGWRAAAANLSDLAAMGAWPLGITVGLSLPGSVSVDWVEQLYQGMVDCLQPYNTPIVGGDICRSAVTTITITAFGQVDPNQVIQRSTAQPGDLILVTGYHGASRAGLEFLLQSDWQPELTPTDRASLIRAHQYPVPRLDGLADRPPGRISGMDSSDGLADAVLQICRSSGVGAILDRATLPIHPALSGSIPPELAMQWTLYGGEDFELMLCLPSAAAHQWLEHWQRLGEGATIVGQIQADPEVRLIDSQGNEPGQLLHQQAGFQHFQSSISQT